MKFLARLLGGKPQREALRTGRQPLHHAGFPLVLLFSQKAGCSSLVKWFFFHIGKLDEALEYDSWIHRYRVEVFLRQPGYAAEAARLLSSRERPVVKLVRNPYERAVSSFVHCVRGARRHRQAGWEMALLKAAREQAGKPEGEQPRLAFRDFMRFLAANGTAFEQINGHVAQQYVAEEEGLVSRIIRLEDFDAEIRRLEADYGLKPSPLAVITSSRHHVDAARLPTAGPAGCAADREIAPWQARGNAVPSYPAMYDEETAALVRACFAADFEKYGYGDAVPGR